jgi:uncharacterized protein (TIGR03435 family)
VHFIQWIAKKGVEMTRTMRFAAVTISCSILFLWFADTGRAQVQNASSRFETLSVKHDLGGLDTHVGPKAHYQTQFPDYKGNRLSGETQLGNWVYYAFYPLRPDREQFNNLDDSHEFYQIQATAPTGTTVEEARIMLRQVLVDRLGLQYHMTEKVVPVFKLVRGGGPLKLTPSTDIHKSPLMSAGGRGGFKGDSASIADFAGFLSTVAGHSVVDKTGLEGNYKFDVDWNKEIENSAESDPQHAIDPGVALEGVKRFGLKLEPDKETRQFLVVDRVNKEPTPN